MSGRTTRALIAFVAGLPIIVTLGLYSAGPAGASALRPAAHRATPECLILPNCVSVYEFGLVSWPQLVLEATSMESNAPVVLGADSPMQPSQDWTYIDLGTVAGYQRHGPRGALLLNKFDVANYGGDEVYQLEFSPDGRASGYCAANVSNLMVLRICNGSQFQTLIAASELGDGRASPVGYWYGLSAVHAIASARHLSVTGSRSPGAQVTFTRPVASDTQFWQSG